ncbi:Hypothetical predicted protein [Paramuricea clavata]|uniref:Uncharacterized protein n=1 Tax=Paramuricea clavata TaxID=317549 RepID=A0A6S7FN17_PARCT|nr:Hypothetical predicted protein [Paramuricea clavata]
MGKDAEIRLVDYVNGGSKGIFVSVTVCAGIVVVDCSLDNPKGRTYLGRPTDFEEGEEEERVELLEVWRERREELVAEDEWKRRRLEMELEEDESFQRMEGMEIWAETEEECLEREMEEEEAAYEEIVRIADELKEMII